MFGEWIKLEMNILIPSYVKERRKRLIEDASSFVIQIGVLVGDGSYFYSLLIMLLIRSIIRWLLASNIW